MSEKIFYIDRKTKELKEEKIYFEKTLRFLYGSRWGKWIGKKIAHLPWCSRLSGWYQRLPVTRRRINPFVKMYEIDITECEGHSNGYSSFDAFFTRKLVHGVRSLAEGVIVPADGRYLFYQNMADCDGFIVKGKKFFLKKLLGSASLAQTYARGSMAIARLCPSDYHRFHFPVRCTPSAAQLINGPLFSVNPISLRQNIERLTENKRMITRLATEQHGEILFIEIGATNVGSIHQVYSAGKTYEKGEEKGFFSFGGSSIILLFEENRIRFAEDLVQNSIAHIETLCLFGQPLEKALIKAIAP